MNTKWMFGEYLQMMLPALTGVEKNIGLLFYKHFDSLLAVSGKTMKRSKYVASLLEQYEELSAAAILVPPLNEDKTDYYGLVKLEVERFRGIKQRAALSFSRDVTLIYGGNGTGKSSICQALEYAICGTVVDAAKKRLKDSAFIGHVGSVGKSRIAMQAITLDGELVNVKAQGKKYAYCFIDKNRIDEFARLSAVTATNQLASIAALLNKVELHQFVQMFSETAEKYVELDSRFADEEKKTEQKIAVYEEQLAAVQRERMGLLVQEQQLLKKYGCAIVEEGLRCLEQEKLAFIRSNQVVDVQQLLEREQATDFSGIVRAFFDLEMKLLELEQVEDQLQRQQQQIAYKELYELVSMVQDRSKCPVCQTAVDETAENPFAFAETQLQQMEVIIELQHKQRLLQQQCERLFVVVKDGVLQLKDFAKELRVDLPDSFSERLDGLELEMLCSKEDFEAGVSQLSAAISSKLKELASAQLEEAARLQQMDSAMAELNGYLSARRFNEQQLQLLETQMKAERGRLEALQEAFQLEKVRLDRMKEVVKGYHSFRVKLRKFHEQQLLGQLANLEGLTLQLFNCFKEKANSNYRLRRIELPKSNASGVISIATMDGVSGSASVLLSEGNLRLLGLSILLAKAMTDQLPFLVLDDVIDALDEHHRVALVDTLFTDEVLSTKQMIITAHYYFAKEINTLIKQRTTLDLVRLKLGNETDVSLELV